MLKIRRTGDPFHLEHGSIDEHRNKSAETQKTKIKILVDQKIARYIGTSRGQYGFVSETVKKEGVEMTFMAYHVKDGFARWYLMMFGDYAQILEPESLKKRIRELLKKTESRLLG